MKGIIGLAGLAVIAIVGLSSTCSAPEVNEKTTDAKVVDFAKRGGEGIEFSKMRLEEAKKAAIEKDKLIFIDAYTSWCGPCKQMAATSFKDQEVGKVFNEKFINLKIEMEKDPDGKEVAMKYNVRAYPTLIIIDGEGNLVKQVIGFQTKDRLLALAQSVI